MFPDRIIGEATVYAGQVVFDFEREEVVKKADELMREIRQVAKRWEIDLHEGSVLVGSEDVKLFARVWEKQR